MDQHKASVTAPTTTAVCDSTHGHKWLLAHMNILRPLLVGGAGGSFSKIGLATAELTHARDHFLSENCEDWVEKGAPVKNRKWVEALAAVTNGCLRPDGIAGADGEAQAANLRVAFNSSATLNPYLLVKADGDSLASGAIALGNPFRRVLRLILKESGYDSNIGMTHLRKLGHTWLEARGVPRKQISIWFEHSLAVAEAHYHITDAASNSITVATAWAAFGGQQGLPGPQKEEEVEVEVEVEVGAHAAPSDDDDLESMPEEEEEEHEDPYVDDRAAVAKRTRRATAAASAPDARRSASAGSQRKTLAAPLPQKIPLTATSPAATAGATADDAAQADTMAYFTPEATRGKEPLIRFALFVNRVYPATNASGGTVRRPWKEMVRDRPDWALAAGKAKGGPSELLRERYKRGNDWLMARVPQEEAPSSEVLLDDSSSGDEEEEPATTNIASPSTPGKMTPVTLLDAQRRVASPPGGDVVTTENTAGGGGGVDNVTAGGNAPLAGAVTAGTDVAGFVVSDLGRAGGSGGGSIGGGGTGEVVGGKAPPPATGRRTGARARPPATAPPATRGRRRAWRWLSLPWPPARTSEAWATRCPP